MAKRDFKGDMDPPKARPAPRNEIVHTVKKTATKMVNVKGQLKPGSLRGFDNPKIGDVVDIPTEPEHAQFLLNHGYEFK